MKIQRQKIDPTKFRPATVEDFRQQGRFKLNRPFYTKLENSEFIFGAFTTNRHIDLEHFKNLIKEKLIYVHL